MPRSSLNCCDCSPTLCQSDSTPEEQGMSLSGWRRVRRAVRCACGVVALMALLAPAAAAQPVVPTTLDAFGVDSWAEYVSDTGVVAFHGSSGRAFVWTATTGTIEITLGGSQTRIY